MREGDSYLHFRIVRYIDSGRFGDVYEALNTTQADRRVAVKIVWKRHNQNDEQEAESHGVELQKRLRSYDSRVVEIFNSGKDPEGNFFIEMEFVDGQDLVAAVLQPTTIAHIGHELCEMLEHLSAYQGEFDGKAHSGAIHGDLKPKNIRLSNRGAIKVLDFGIAKSMSATGTAPQSEWVSKAYASPERLITGTLDMRCDLWSVGVLMYQMIAGRLPFEGEGEWLERRIKSAVPPEPLPQTCPKDLSSIVFKMLAFNPSDRYASAKDNKEDLERCCKNEPVLAKPYTGEETVRTTQPGSDDSTVRSSKPKPLHTASSLSVLARWKLQTAKPSFRLGTMALFGILFIWFLSEQFRVWNDSTKLRSELVRDAVSVDDGWTRFQEIRKRAWLPLITLSARGALQDRLISAGNAPIDDYRNNEKPSAREGQWRRSDVEFDRVLELRPSDKNVKARKRLCEAHLKRIASQGLSRATREKAQYEAAAMFREAADLNPSWPDPYIGLLRLYTFEDKDPDKATQALNEAHKRGQPVRNRENAQLADAYAYRAHQGWSNSFQLRAYPDQEKPVVQRAQQDCNMAKQLYRDSSDFENSVRNLVAMSSFCRSVDARAEQLDSPFATTASNR